MKLKSVCVRGSYLVYVLLYSVRIPEYRLCSTGSGPKMKSEEM
jgi:hypothetical protein